MTGKRKSSPRKHSPQRVAPSSPPLSALRRSMRVQKPPTLKHGKTKKASTAGLLDAARFMQEAHQQEQHHQEQHFRRPSKRVTFNGENASAPVGTTYLPPESPFTFKRRTSLAGSTPSHPFRHSYVEEESAAPPRPVSDRKSSASSRRMSKSSLRTNSMGDSGMKHNSDNYRPSTGSKRSFDAQSTSDAVDMSSKRMRGFDAGLPSNPTTLMLSQLRFSPHILKLSQIYEILKLIQEKIFGSQGFSTSHFDFELSTAQSAAWPMHELRTKYIPLYLTTKWLADGSQTGWHEFFTKSHSRQHLVSAILAEWFVERIFKHTAFGLPQKMVNALEDKDREYLHFDAIVRSKQRATMMKAWLEDPVTLFRITESTQTAAESLTEELMQVLHPLLPPDIFDPLSDTDGTTNTSADRRDSITRHKQKLREQKSKIIRDELCEIILDCSALHKAIRLTGENGTIIRMVPHIQKGELYHPTAAADLINGEYCDATEPQNRTEQSELCIKMTCWPRVEAVVPQGPDMAQLQYLEQEYRRDLEIDARLAPKRRRMRTDGDDDDDGSSSSSSDSDGDRSMSDNSISDYDDFTWDDKDEIWPIVPDNLQDEEGRNPGILNPETNRINTIKRGAYVTVHPVVCPAKVYCEWTPLPYIKGQTLTEAVTLARKTHAKSMSLRIEDIRINAWNAYALYGGLAQWGVLTTGAIIAICRIYHIPTHIQDILIKTLNGADRLMKATVQLTTIPITQIPGYIIESLMSLVEELWLAMGPFGTALATPVKTLIADPLRRIFEIVRLVPSSVPGFQEASYRAGQMKRAVGSEARGLSSNVASVWSSASSAFGVALAAGAATRSRESANRAETLRLAHATAGANIPVESVWAGRTMRGELDAAPYTNPNSWFQGLGEGGENVAREWRPVTVPSSQIQNPPSPGQNYESMHDFLTSRYPDLPPSYHDSIVTDWASSNAASASIKSRSKSVRDVLMSQWPELPKSEHDSHLAGWASSSAANAAPIEPAASIARDTAAVTNDAATEVTTTEAASVTGNGGVTYTMLEQTPVERPSILSRISDGVQDVIHGRRGGGFL